MSHASSGVDSPTKIDPITVVIGAYLSTAFLIAGPWIFTVLSLGAMTLIACPQPVCSDVQVFKSVMIYNFVFSLIVAGPIVYPLARRIGERLDTGRLDGAFMDIAAGAALYLLATLLIAGPFYLASSLSASEKLLGFANLGVLGFSWLLPFVLARRHAPFVALVFGAGGCAAVLLLLWIQSKDAVALLFAFTFGMALINAALTFRAARLFGWRAKLGPISYSIRIQWEPPLLGLTFFLGLWIDKILMWTFASDRLRIGSVFVTMPDYDTAFFWAQLSVLPALAFYVKDLGDPLAAEARRFFREIATGATSTRLQAHTTLIVRTAVSGVLVIIGVQMLLALTLALLSFVALEPLSLRASQMGMFRYALLGAALHVGVMFCITILLSFDLRRPALLVSLFFLVANAGLTTASIAAGFSFYGAGFAAAGALSFILAVGILATELNRLRYHAFITNNPSAFPPPSNAVANTHG